MGPDAVRLCTRRHAAVLRWRPTPPLCAQLPASAVPEPSCLVPEEQGGPGGRRGSTPGTTPPLLPREGDVWVPYSFSKVTPRPQHSAMTVCCGQHKQRLPCCTAGSA